MNTNINPQEIQQFDAIAAHWWDPDGDFKPLHAINPLRLHWIQQQVHLAQQSVVDVGCGGGLLTEALARAGAQATGIDVAPASLEVARLHLLESTLTIHYQHCTAEQLALEQPATFDIVTCMEMLEHVPDPGAVIQACAQLVKPGGWVFFSTFNRQPKAYFYGILGAEYLLRLLPKGTHRYSQFIRPSELEQCAREAGLALQQLTGLHYNPLLQRYYLGPGVAVNYMASFIRLPIARHLL